MIISTWRAWRRLTPVQRRLVVEAAGLLIAVRMALTVLPARITGRWVAGGGPRRSTVTVDPEVVDRVAWAISAAARYLPLGTTCLIDALAARQMLYRRGLAPHLRIGVSPARLRSPFRAHAWLECDGSVVTGGSEDLATYAVLRAQRS